ncbi:STAS domain-containing protein [Dactylosporangium siamense]|uniref:Anti-sigma factor antagonist n=1 Tax=Dactylosporangium siamense TaxID=685454 RepID=A0A919PKZ5_9ACTN|nr:STAS domain-containing protein [Dactylosporangium siamense]GIG43953.1 hypothetical protein Dsi01nite_019940 [Dactylosporangium siamense]
MDLSLSTRPGRGCTVVVAAGVLDLATVPQLRTCLELEMDGGALRIVLDLAGVRLIDSSALGTLVSVSRTLRQRAGLLCLAAPQPIVRQVFELTSVQRIVDVYDTVAAAEDGLVMADGAG